MELHSVGDGLRVARQQSGVKCGVEEVHGLLTVGVPATVPLQRKQQEGSEASDVPASPLLASLQPRQLSVRSCCSELDDPGPLRSHYPERPEHTRVARWLPLSGSASSGPVHSTTSSSAGFRRPVLTVLSAVR